MFHSVTDWKREHLLSRIHDLEAENSRLAQMAITDDLTSAYNRRHFDEYSRRDWTWDSARHSLALCLFDVDNFKAYNDSYGHGAGDDALRLIADVVMRQLRQGRDLLFRLGGDEFCVLLYLDSADSAVGIVDRLRRNVRELALPSPRGRDGVLTISFGVVWRDDRRARMATPWQLYLDADRMLYEAKRNGRDQIRLAGL
ncbi:GGDEF domain-containing protein [Trinickia terrae]|nr:GGDEF domain-containing protein [Trinickia terrae]